MKGKVRFLAKDRFIFYTLLITTLFLVLSSVSIFLSYASLPPLIPIFNSMPWGISRLYDSNIVIFIPAIMFGVVIINTIITLAIYKNYVLLGRIISFNSLLFSVLTTLAYLQILLLIY